MCNKDRTASVFGICHICVSVVFDSFLSNSKQEASLCVCFVIVIHATEEIAIKTSMSHHSAAFNRMLNPFLTIFAFSTVEVCATSHFVASTELCHYLSYFDSIFVIKVTFMRGTFGQNGFCRLISFCFFGRGRTGSNFSIGFLFLSLLAGLPFRVFLLRLAAGLVVAVVVPGRVRGLFRAFLL